MRRFWTRAWWLLPLCVSCDGGLKLVVVEQTNLGAAASGATGGSSAGAASGGVTSVVPQGGGSSQGGTGQSSAGGMAGTPDELPTVAGAAGAADVPFWEVPARYTASFTAYTFPDQYIHYVDNKSFIGPIDMASLAEQETASFEMTPGLWKPECSSFRAVNTIGAFLRHANSRVYLNPASDEPLFLADATFCEVPGMADPAGVTFRSSNFPDRVIHLRNQNELWIDDVPAPEADTYKDFAAQSTFYKQTALNETVSP